MSNVVAENEMPLQDLVKYVRAKTSKPLRSLPSVQGCTCGWVVLGGCQECVDWRMTHS